jgi:hypothetical protein
MQTPHSHISSQSIHAAAGLFRSLAQCPDPNWAGGVPVRFLPEISSDKFSPSDYLVMSISMGY